MYIRKGTYSIDRVLPYIPLNPEDPKVRNYDGVEVKLWSLRYAVFATKGIICHNCGLTGEFFALEKFPGEPAERYHLNLYTIDNGVEVMMVKGHIVPLTQGGVNNIDNRATFCAPCNNERNRVPSTKPERKYEMFTSIKVAPNDVKHRISSIINDEEVSNENKITSLITLVNEYTDTLQIRIDDLRRINQIRRGGGLKRISTGLRAAIKTKGSITSNNIGSAAALIYDVLGTIEKKIDEDYIELE